MKKKQKRNRFSTTKNNLNIQITRKIPGHFVYSLRCDFVTFLVKHGSFWRDNHPKNCAKLSQLSIYETVDC